jgi:hypothetical protein
MMVICVHVQRCSGVAAFRDYYAAQELFPDDVDELDRLVRTLQKPLPISFRVSRVAEKQAIVDDALKEARPFLDVCADSH